MTNLRNELVRLAEQKGATVTFSSRYPSSVNVHRGRDFMLADVNQGVVDNLAEAIRFLTKYEDSTVEEQDTLTAAWEIGYTDCKSGKASQFRTKKSAEEERQYHYGWTEAYNWKRALIDQFGPEAAEMEGYTLAEGEG